MFRPIISEEMKNNRVNGATNCLRDVEKYIQAVAYGDTQRFR